MIKKLLPIVSLFICTLILGTVIYIVQNNNFDKANAQISLGNTSNTDDKYGIYVAKENIKEFSGKQDLQVNFMQNLTSPNGKFYRLSADDGTYYIDTKTGEVEAVAYLIEPNNGQPSDILLSKDQAESIAIAFINKHDKNFSINKNISIVYAELLDHGTSGKEYTFAWSESINGIITLNKTIVSVDAVTGNINSYVNIKRPIEVKLTSNITKEQAINTAIGQFKNITVIQSDAALGVVYKDDGSQVLAWVVGIKGQPTNGIPQGGEVRIDANTEETIGIYPYQ